MLRRYSNPAAETLLSVLEPLLNDSVIATSGIDIPGASFTGERAVVPADVFLVGEFESVAICFSSTSYGVDWSPKYPIGLLTEVYTIPAVTTFFHLDDIAFLLSTANPSLFKTGARQELKMRASRIVREVAPEWESGSLSVAFPATYPVDLDVTRQTSIHRLERGKRALEKAA